MEDKHKPVSDEQLAAFLDGNASADEISRIISSTIADDEMAEILSLSPEIDRLVSDENRRIIPMLALAAANPENLCSFDCETFILHNHDFDIDHWSLLETAKANNWIREGGTPLHHVGRLLELKGMHVERKYDATPADIENALGDGRELIAIVDKTALDTMAKPCGSHAYHAIYVTAVDEYGDIVYLDMETLHKETIHREVFLNAWKCSRNYMVTVNRNPAGYNPQPIDVGEIDIDADLEDLTEAIAENAHDIWARARMDEGWTYGPVRDDTLLTHPDLVPYAMLPDSEKEYDRIMAMNTLRLVHRLGFDIINRNEA